LSPEKNHARLIKAFDIVHRDNPNTRLVIIGGGPLAPDLAALVVELGLVTDVTLAGWQYNPYAIMANSDCFVLPSDYEGQPMVLLEAMVLGLPIVTTDFGIRAYLSGNIPTPFFDYVEHNQKAVRQFYQAIGAVAATDPQNKDTDGRDWARHSQLG
jgi:CDP-glycerol glycerophosphotransferase